MKKLNNIPQNTGYNPQGDLAYEEKDIQYSSVETVDVSKLPEEYLPNNPKPDYQDGRPFCFAHGPSYALRLLRNKDYSEPFIAAMAEWKEHFHSDGTPNEDYIPTAGGYIKLALWIIQHYGVCEESFYPPNKDWKELALKKNISQDAFDNALQNKIGLYTRIGNSGWGGTNKFEILDAIKKYKCAIVGFRYWKDGWYRNISEPTQIGKTCHHCIIFDGWRGLDNTLIRYKNWYDPEGINITKGRGGGWMKLSDWIPHLAGVFAITTLPVKKMYQRYIDLIKKKGEQYFKVNGDFWHIPDADTLDYLLKMGWVTKDTKALPEGTTNIKEMPMSVKATAYLRNGYEIFKDVFE